MSVFYFVVVGYVESEVPDCDSVGDEALPSPLVKTNSIDDLHVFADEEPATDHVRNA